MKARAEGFYIASGDGTYQRVTVSAGQKKLPRGATVLTNAMWYGGGFVGNPAATEKDVLDKLKGGAVRRIGEIPAEVRRAQLIEDMQNPIFLTDSYKVSHWKMYPKGMTRAYAYMEARGGKYDDVVFAGLQYQIDRYLAGRVVTRERIDRAQAIFDKHLGKGVFNREGWEYILRKYNGHLPLKIKAVPEGMVVGNHNIVLSIENTDPKCAWLVNYFDPLITQCWYPSTVAPGSREMLKIINRYLEKNGDPSLLPFKLHDFGFRGSTSVESAAIGGVAHMMNSMGSDNIPALLMANNVYGADMAGFSIPASEHSVTTLLGPEGEAEMIRNVLNAYPNGLVACVMDTYDIHNAVANHLGETLREQILSRDGCLVVRPDSGDAVKVLCGDPSSSDPLEQRGLLDILGDKFGFERNDKINPETGEKYKVLNPKVRLIQGDGIDPANLVRILEAMDKAGWSADNIAFGSGGGLLQKDINRDTNNWAIKTADRTIDGVSKGVRKAPKGSFKFSKIGEQKLIMRGGKPVTVPDTKDNTDPNILRTVFFNGASFNRVTFAEARTRTALEKMADAA